MFVAVAELFALFGSSVDDVTFAIVLIVAPFDVASGTVAANVYGFDAPLVNVAIVQVIVPLAPTAGVVHDQPLGGVNEVNVAGAGSVIVNVAFVASFGPLFVTLPL